MSRYQCFITKDKRIFWTKNSVDKPTKDYFNKLMNTITWTQTNDIAINWISQFNAQIVLDDNDYTYIKLVDTKKNSVRYYHIDSVEKELSNGYVVNISLDVFTSYTFNVLDNLKKYPIMVNRTSAWGLYDTCKNAQMLPDELLTYNSFVKLKCKLPYNNFEKDINRYSEPDGQGGYKDTTLPQAFTLRMEMGANAQKMWEHMLCDVYLFKDGSIMLLPIANGYYGIDMWKLTQAPGTYTGANVWTEQIADVVKTLPQYINQYKGRYYIPFLYNIIIGNTPHLLMVKNNQAALFFYIKIQDINWTRVPDVYYECDFTPEFNFTTTLPTPYLISKYHQLGYNTPILKVIYNKGNNTFKYIPWVLANSKYIYDMDFSNGYTISNYDTNTSISWKGISTLPTTTNEYLAYTASISSQQNTGIEIERQRLHMGLAQSAIGSLMNIGQQAFSGNIMGVLSGGVSSGFDLVNKTLQYENSQRMLAAKHADKMRVSSANVFSSQEQAINYCSHNMIEQTVPIGTKPIEYCFNLLLIGLTNSNDVSDANRVIWENGYKINNTIKLSDYETSNVGRPYSLNIYSDLVNQFIYWDLTINKDYIKMINNSVDNDLNDAIYVTINQPIRMWNIAPDYNLKLQCKGIY